jgi:hypothetical protein
LAAARMRRYDETSSAILSPMGGEQRNHDLPPGRVHISHPSLVAAS